MSLVWGLPSRVGVVVGRLRRPLNNPKRSEATSRPQDARSDRKGAWTLLAKSEGSYLGLNKLKNIEF